MIKNAVIAALAVAVALSVAGAVAQVQRTSTVEVRVWEDIEDPTRQMVSSRVAGGEWRPAVELSNLYDGFVQAGRFRYRDVWVGATEPVPIPPAIELFDVTCQDHGHRSSPHLILVGSFRNASEATLGEVTITAALVNEDGVEVVQKTDVVAGGIAPGGERDFSISFFGETGVTGTCPILSIDYSGTVRYGP